LLLTTEARTQSSCRERDREPLREMYSRRYGQCGRSYGGSSGGLGMLQFFYKVSFQRGSQRSDGNEAETLAAKRVNGGVLLGVGNDGANRVARDMALGPQRLHGRRHLGSLPDYFHFALHTGGQ